MQGWLQGRFSVRPLDVLVEKITGISPAKEGKGIDVAIDFKRPRKTDSDADKAIDWWLTATFSKEIADRFGRGESYVSRLLRIGAQRMGLTLEGQSKTQRKERPRDPSRLPGYQWIADEVKGLLVGPTVSVLSRCQKSALQHHHHQRVHRGFGLEVAVLPVPKFEDWSAAGLNSVLSCCSTRTCVDDSGNR